MNAGTETTTLSNQVSRLVRVVSKLKSKVDGAPQSELKAPMNTLNPGVVQSAIDQIDDVIKDLDYIDSRLPI